MIEIFPERIGLVQLDKNAMVFRYLKVSYHKQYYKYRGHKLVGNFAVE